MAARYGMERLEPIFGLLASGQHMGRLNGHLEHISDGIQSTRRFAQRSHRLAIQRLGHRSDRLELVRRPGPGRGDVSDTRGLSAGIHNRNNFFSLAAAAENRPYLELDYVRGSQVIPEPGSFAMLGAGLLAVAAIRIRGVRPAKGGPRADPSTGSLVLRSMQRRPADLMGRQPRL